MKVERLILGEFQTNAYICWTDASKQCLVVDAPDPSERLLDRIDELKLVPEVLLITHAHIDHIGGLPEVKKAFPEMKVAAGEGAAEAFVRPSMNLSLLVGRPLKFPEPDVLLSEGSTIGIEGAGFTASIVEGHAPGSVCLVSEHKPHAVFTGDTVFQQSIGRTDLPGGDTNVLISGIRERILSLPNESVLYPGHGPETTVEAERSNPFLK